MNMAKRLEALEAALAKECGDFGYRMVMVEDGETSEQAKQRSGLADWQGHLIFLSFADANL